MTTLLPNGEQTFVDQNGDPISGGSIYTYVPGTTTPDPTYVDSGLTVQNTNPVILDQAGRCIMWADGVQRQVVYDMFGNLQWDRETGLIVTSIPGNVTVTGTLTVTGGLNVGGEIVGGQLLINGPATVQGDLGVAGHTTTQDLSVNGTAGINVANIGTLTVQNEVALNDLHVGGALFGDNGGPANELLIEANTVTQTGNRYLMEGGSSPGIAFANTTPPAITLGIWNASQFLQFGLCNGDGSPNTEILNIDTIDNLIRCVGDIVPQTDNQASCGLGDLAWANVVAHNYITVSTDATSEAVTDGMLDVVAAVPVKTLPHLGIAREDLAAYDWAQTDVGVNYNTIVGALWQALKELNVKFESYAAAHP